ncbi:MAG: HAMP domain-containing sensor histidine kinase [Saprospiraceae bacterium]|nr:HAMP domain-containing sensor histidine kinase [Saprospiraceae bacterium]MDZ4705671.1 HAMP domain-containing sensor histidine kinase [Saprospiraceae bacterium]
MRLPRLTIRQRLPLLISISALLILLLVGFFIYVFSERFYEQEFKARILERLTEADSLIALDQSHPFTVINNLPAGELPDEKIFYAADPRLIILPNGTVPLSQVIDTTKFDLLPYCFAHVGQRDYGIRHNAITHHTLVVSAVDRYGHTKIRNLRNGIITGVLFGVVLLTFTSWFWVRKMLQPIANKIAKARTIGAKSLNLRLDVKNNHDELGLLALTFNEMLERIEQGFRTQQQFIRNASHEIRTPLTAIIAEADLALQQSRTPENYRYALENVSTQAEKLNELVSKLLLLAKVEGNIRFSDRTCAPDEALMIAFRALQVKYPTASQSIQLHIELPDAYQLLVRCDPDILEIAFFNLLDNAVKYGNGHLVRVRLSLLDQLVCLEVADHGVGIAPDDMEHLFKPFYRSKHNSHLPGSGIGLSLVKTIADKYGGSIQIESEPKQGTTVMLCFPRNMNEVGKI